jgi:protoheme IX farnesyltransferase
MLRIYYYLTKPGIIYGNALNTIAGFFLASQGNYNFKLLGITLLGISLVVASACVFNNILDKDIDGKMERTKKRAMVTGTIPKINAIIFGIVLLILGVLSLSLFSNLYSLIAALTGFAVYVFIYTFLKRKTTWGTEVGSISGAIPPLVGYLAVSNKIDAGAIILFLIFTLWQMPHFYAIAIYRMKEYAEAGIPVLSVVKGVYRTKINTLVYIIAFLVSLISLKFYGYAGNVYLVIMGLAGLYWLYMGIKGFKAADDNLWAKKMFRLSLIVVLLFCLILPIDAIIKL